MAQATYREILNNIVKGTVSPVNILMGEEDYYIDVLVNAFEQYVVDDADKDFNYNVFFGVDADIDQIIACCQQLPVMAPKRLVILKEAQTIGRGKQQLDKFASYVKKANRQCVLVIAYKGDNLNSTSELIKSVNKSEGLVFKAERERDYKLPNCVKDYCNTHKIGIEEGAVNMLCEYIGGPLSKLFGELTKLIEIKKEEGGKVNVDDVRKHIGISKEYNNFELISSIAKKDYPKAVRIIRYFASNPKTNPTVLTTAMLLNFFSKLVIAHYLPEKNDNSYKTALGIKNMPALNELKDGLRNYNAYQAVYSVHAIRDFDVKSKGVGSQQNEYELLKELIFKIFTL